MAALAVVGCGGGSGPIDGQPVTFVNPQGEGRGLLFRPGQPGKLPAVVALHGDHGLTPRVEELARQLSRAGFLVLAVDLYRGEKVENLLDAHILDRGLPQDRVKADVRAAVDLLAARPDAGPVGVVGWDMGGGYALDAARDDPRLKAVVTCYGRLTTDPALLKRMDAAVLALMAGKDEGNGPETLKAFREAMAEAGKQLTLRVFDGCDHGFMNPPPGVKLNEQEVRANEAALAQIREFLATRLGAK